MKKRILAYLLTGTIVLGLTACGSRSEGTSSVTQDGTQTVAADTVDADAGVSEQSPAKTGEIEELSMLSMPANVSGIAGGWWGEELEKAVGIKLNLLPSGDQGEQKLQALMASGDLPDLLVFKDNKQVENAVSGDMLLAYDDYKELLPNLYANAGEALQYAAENLSLGKGKSYVVGTKVKNAPETRGNKGPYLRYDLYEKIGSPAITNGDDLLNALKSMQELEPVNEDGQKVYAISAFKDWDRSYMTLGMFYSSIMGAHIPSEGVLAEVHFDDPSNPTFTTILDDNSKYMEWVRLLYKANQLGLLDPDSISQRFEDTVQKTKEGRVLMVLDGWGSGDFNTQERQNQGIGVLPVMTSGYKRSMDGLQLEGTNWTLAVSKNTKHVEKAMAFVDWMATYEGARISENGPRGVMWDFNDEGKPVYLEKKYEIDKNPDQEFAGGKNYALGGNQTGIRVFWTSSVDPENGCTVSGQFWEEPSYAPAVTEVWKKWRENYGALDPNDYIMQDESRYFLNPMTVYPTFTDEMEQISARVGDIVKTASWKMAFAADDAEYQSLKDKMVESASEVGIDRFVSWYAEEYMKLWNEAVTK